MIHTKLVKYKMDEMQQICSNYSDFRYIFERKVCIKLNRVVINECNDTKKDGPKTAQPQHLRVTRSRKIQNLHTDWARISKGIYKGDIARVESLDNDSGLVWLKIFPRIDWDTFFSDGTEKEFSKRRPPPKLFDPNDTR